MKLTWKIFFSTLVITICTFSVGGFILVNFLFHTALAREKAAALLRTSMQSVVTLLATSDEGTVQSAIHALGKRMVSDKLSIWIGDQALQTMSESSRSAWPALNYLVPEAGQVILTIDTDGGRHFIQTACMVNRQDAQTIYLETYGGQKPISANKAVPKRILQLYSHRRLPPDTPAKQWVKLICP